MWRRLYDRKGQSTGEYALVFAIILGAIIAMQTYVKRGMQGRVKSGSDYMARLTGEQTGVDAIAVDGPHVAAGGKGIVTQYDPYDYTSSYQVGRSSTVIQKYGAGESKTIIPLDTPETTTRLMGGSTEHTEAEWQDVEHEPDIAPAP